MATINYKIKGKDISTIYCRLTHTRAIDLWCKTNVLVRSDYWDKKQQKIKNVIAVKNRDAVNRKLALLKIHLTDEFNDAYMNGDVIDKYWLKDCISAYFNRPEEEENNSNNANRVYYTDFALWWLESIAPTRLIANNKYMTERDISKYKKFISMVVEFQDKTKLKLMNVTNLTITDFVNFLIEDGYNIATIKRHVNRFKFFCTRATEEGIKVNSAYKKRVFVPKAIEIKEPYLNPKEIDLIFNHDFSDSKRLENVRDNLIISVWTGLRISDFSRLNIENFIDDYIEIRTKKTETDVVIPVHKQIKQILIRRKGNLPKVISDVNFNKYVKEVCKEVGIKGIMKGKLMCKKKKRKVVGMFPKYKLISSHIGRRSMATNLIGHIDDVTIMKICGWSDKSTMYHYVKKSNKEYATKLKEHWENK